MPVTHEKISSKNTVTWEVRGRIEYADAMALMENLAGQVKKGDRAGMLLFLEHPPVITLGRRADRTDIIASSELIEKMGYRVFHTDRGGKATCHGPGQLVGYIILDLLRLGIGVRKLIKGVEETLIRSLAFWGVEARRKVGRPGVWVGGNKIAAIGMRVKEHTTSHGFALNVDFDLSSYNLIVPCGMRNAAVTNLSEHVNEVPSYQEAARVIAEKFAQVFTVEMKGPESAAMEFMRSRSASYPGKEGRYK